MGVGQPGWREPKVLIADRERFGHPRQQFKYEGNGNTPPAVRPEVEHHRDRVGAKLSQFLRVAIDRIAVIARDLEHAIAGFGCDQRAIVKHA